MAAISSGNMHIAGTARRVIVALAALPPAVPGLILVILGLLLLQPAAASPGYLAIILRQAAPLGLLALGQSLVVMNRSLDLSVGGTVALVNVMLAGSLVSSAPAWLSFLLPLVFGAAIGGLNGFLVARLRASAVIVTLGVGLALYGLSLIVSQGAPGGSIHPALADFARWRLFGIPSAALLWLALTALMALALRRTAWGLAAYAYGNAPHVAVLSGLPATGILIVGHVLSGMMAGLAGLMLTGYIGTGTLRLGEDLVLASIAATILGGVTFAGGRGGPLGVAAGALLLVLLGAGLTMLGVGAPGKLVVTGLVVAGAALLMRR
jgi:ribose transport system permease protein